MWERFSTAIYSTGQTSANCFMRAPPLAARGQSDQKRNIWDSVPKSAVVGFRIS
ncbi:hypothetical protein D1AOALGA4SA_11777 [Olavius algarvensis Delta 1 endosymbiont]|nr:hypothetical protein D1AOALGA4SA_11777 [Olavius algarvensis Delta 1 endosymbiont]